MTTPALRGPRHLRRRRPWDRLRHRATVRHAGVVGGYLVLTVLLLRQLWQNPAGVVLHPDQYLTEWYLWHGAHALAAGANPLSSTLLGAPDGVNLMANSSVLALALPLAPVTLLAGAPLALAVALTVGVAGSAAAWFWLLWQLRAGAAAGARGDAPDPRTLPPGSIWPPALGGLFCGFAPAIVAHARGTHLHLAVTAAVPFIVALALRPGRGGVARRGIVLGLLVTAQAFLGQELLLLTALGLAVFCAAVTALSPEQARRAALRVAATVGIGAAVAAVLLAFPLWWQFAGPQSFSAIPDAGATVNDPRSMLALPSLSFIGDPDATRDLAASATEENAFFGLPLIIVLAVGLWHLRRDRLARACAITFGVACALSLVPWTAWANLPALGSVTPSRITLVAIAPAGVLLTLTAARAAAAAADLPRPQAQRVRAFASMAIVAAVVAVAPAPLPVAGRPPPPPFVADGTWRVAVVPGSTVLTIPPSTMESDVIGWQIATGGAFALVGGDLLGPSTDHSGQRPQPVAATAQLLTRVWVTGEEPVVTAAHRRQAREDLAGLGVSTIVVVERGRYEPVIRVLTELLDAAPLPVGGVWTWRLRDGMAIR